MVTQLCNTQQSNIISRESITELDFHHLFRAFFIQSRKPDEDVHNFLQTYLTSDPDEIRRRSSIFGGLMSNPKNRSLIKLSIDQLNKLASSLWVIFEKQRPIVTYIQNLYALEAYISSIECMEKVFDVDAGHEIAKIAETIQNEKSSPFYIQALDTLNRVKGLLDPLKDVTLAVNLTSYGDGLQMGITGINQSEKAVGIFSGIDESPSSLTGFTPVGLSSRRLYITIEEYILTQVEKKWAQPLRTAIRLFNKIDTSKLHEWNNWQKNMSIFHIGLAVMDKFAEEGYTLCRPEPCTDRFDMEEMYYPHMALTKGGPVPQSIRFSTGETILITGANNSGKTSALKTFAQNCLLAQLGLWVPSQDFSFVPFKKWLNVFSSGEDNEMRVSRFQQESEKINAAREVADTGTCLLLNEPFTSTNPAKASDLLKEIVMDLQQKGVTSILVTHNFDVCKKLKSAGAGLRSYVTEAEPTPSGMNHTYKLTEKEPDGLSHAKLLAKEYGFTFDNLVEMTSETQQLEAFLMGGGDDA